VRRGEVRVALLSIEGTNCDDELFVALKALGARPEIVHLKQLEQRDVERSRFRTLDDYQLVFVPGGFSSGDYVRAGAIFAARIRAAIGPQLEAYLQSGRLLGGIGNGFQILTELGLLPGQPGGRLGPPEAALHANVSGHYECRPTFVAWDGGRFPALQHVAKGQRYLFPSGHGEGNLVLGGPPGERLRQLEASGQVLFRWVAPDGSPATYPWNPNGSVGNVAGLTNPEGNVFGLMPHPERNFSRAQLPDWTRGGGAEGPSDGERFFEAVLRTAERTG
jgi:phosphoribosylformylglycinamidine synthase subunit PurQ / glutaminase